MSLLLYLPCEKGVCGTSSKDQAFVDRLQAALNNKGEDYLYAPEHGRWGEELEGQIDREIRIRDRLILVCSAASLHESAWVQKEIDYALQEEERRKKRVIFPIMLDDSLLKWGDPRGKHMLKVLAGDFRKARTGQAFEIKLEKLLAGLRG
ncbi:MAG: toll/interleukin-1 receptor domain-containing protein [Dehalococcoidia bacterium]|nr:toll/interleukin-1 receptor domain-containing protein [Dehalococcoidia bacterium]